MRMHEILIDSTTVTEGNVWQGTDSGSREAAMTDHEFEEATQYIKSVYPFHKTYTVYRAEPGFRAKDDASYLYKTTSHITNVDSALDQLQLKRNTMMSGSVQISKSLGYSWNVLENSSTGIAVLYYQDRGMGSDYVIIAAKNKQQLAGAVGMFRDAGVIPDLAELAARKAEKAAGRTAILQRKGLTVGTKFRFRDIKGNNMWEIIAIMPSGKVKAREVNTGEKQIWNPGSITKSMLQAGQSDVD